MRPLQACPQLFISSMSLRICMSAEALNLKQLERNLWIFCYADVRRTYLISGIDSFALLAFRQSFRPRQAFASTGAMDGAWFVATGERRSFSEQQVWLYGCSNKLIYCALSSRQHCTVMRTRLFHAALNGRT